MNLSLLCIVPLVVIVGLAQAYKPLPIKTNHTFTIEVAVINHDGKIQQVPHKVNLMGDVAEGKPLKLSVHFNTPKEEISEVVEIDVHVSSIHEKTELLEYGKFDTVVNPMTSNTGAVSAPLCWKGYKLVDGVSCYKKNEINKTWKQALNSCAENGARLPTPNTKRKIEQLIKFALGDLASNEESPIWLGIHKHNNVWQTVEGIPVDPSVWAPEEPHHTGECAVVVSGALHAFPCHYIKEYICEQPLKPSTPVNVFLR